MPIKYLYEYKRNTVFLLAITYFSAHTEAILSTHCHNVFGALKKLNKRFS